MLEKNEFINHFVDKYHMEFSSDTEEKTKFEEVVKKMSEQDSLNEFLITQDVWIEILKKNNSELYKQVLTKLKLRK